MKRLKLSHPLVIGLVATLVVTAALALSPSVSAEYLFFFFVISLLNVGLSVAWLSKHREQISTLTDFSRVFRKIVNRNTIPHILMALLLLPVLGLLPQRLFNLSDFTYARIVMLAFVGALYWILLRPDGDRTKDEQHDSTRDEEILG